MALENRQDNYVALNVGGKIYQTSRTTLLRFPGSFFSSLLDGSVPSAKDDQGNYLIDQDGEIFRHVLNFLRYGKLVLPEGFREYGLLECQADFLQLQALKSSIKKPVAMVGGVKLVFVDGKVFKLTREALMKEENTFFTKMLRGEYSVARDSEGSYIIDRESAMFPHIVSYLTQGCITKPIIQFSQELNLLENDAKYFELEKLEAHIESVRFMEKKGSYAPSNCHFYYCNNSPCIAYIAEFRKFLVQNIFCKKFRIAYNVTAGRVDMKLINNTWRASLQDVKAYFEKALEERQVVISQDQPSSDCTRLKVQIS